MCKRPPLIAVALTALLAACATPTPAPDSLSRAGAETRLLDAIGLVPAISVIFDAVAEKRMEDGLGPVEIHRELITAAAR